MNDFSGKLHQAAELAGLQFSSRLEELLAQHWQRLQAANQQFNLTAITEEDAAVEKHYLDCLIAAQVSDGLWPKDAYAADLGSGGGFPGLVLAAAYPARRFMLLESSRKKTDFLNDCAAALGLGNMTALALRAEDAGRQANWRGQFDCVTARAVAELAVLAEYALPLLKPGGLFFAWKGPQPQGEAANAAQALSLLGGEIQQIIAYTLPICGEERSLVVIGKCGETPDKYPRRPGMPVKRPL